MAEQAANNDISTQTTQDTEENSYLDIIKGTLEEEEEAHKKNVLRVKLKFARKVAIPAIIMAIGIAALVTDIVLAAGAVTATSAAVTTGAVVVKGLIIHTTAASTAQTVGSIFGIIFAGISIAGLRSTISNFLGITKMKTDIKDLEKVFEGKTKQIEKYNPQPEPCKAEDKKERIEQLIRQQVVDRTIDRQITDLISKEGLTHLKNEDIKKIKQQIIKNITSQTNNATSGKENDVINYIKSEKEVSKSEMSKSTLSFVSDAHIKVLAFKLDSNQKKRNVRFITSEQSSQLDIGLKTKAQELGKRISRSNSVENSNSTGTQVEKGDKRSSGRPPSVLPRL